MKQKMPSSQNQTNQRGQSLVEVALFLPIFLIILAGVVEVSQLVITQNRVSNAARAGTRFASNGGEDSGVVPVVLNSVTQTLSLDEDVWDLWAIHGVINGSGDGFEEWEFNHIYGISNTVDAPSINEAAIQQEILEELQLDHRGQTPGNIANNLRFVGTYVIHDVDSILGLDAIPWLQGLHSVTELNVMRIIALSAEQTDGCTGFPIAVHEGIRSVTRSGGASPFPNPGDFTYPSSNPPTYDAFLYHQPDVPLSQAQEGYVYRIQNGFGDGNFGWLAWNEGIAANANTLADSLTWPGDSNDYSDHGDGGQVLPGFGHVVRGFAEPFDATDTQMHIGDWVAANTGAVNSNEVRTTLNGHIDRGRALRVLVWDESQAQGNNGRYHISRFGIFRLHGYNLSGNTSWILAEFVGWDDSCGQILQAP